MGKRKLLPSRGGGGWGFWGGGGDGGGGFFFSPPPPPYRTGRFLHSPIALGIFSVRLPRDTAIPFLFVVAGLLSILRSLFDSVACTGVSSIARYLLRGAGMDSK